jgi:hypothetical protein
MSCASIAENARRLRELYSCTHCDGPEYHAACAAFHAQYDSLAFPGGLADGLRKLRACDRSTVETVIDFLEEDPRFFRSGYIKETMLRRLKACPLLDRQKRRLVRLVIRSMDGGGRREFQGYSRLAPVVLSDGLLESVRVRLTSNDAEVARRAALILRVLKSQGTAVID